MSERRTRIATFLVAESELSVKLIFDNLRNMLTATLVVTVGWFFWLRGTEVFVEMTEQFDRTFPRSSASEPRCIDYLFVHTFAALVVVGGVALLAVASAQAVALLELPIGKPDQEATATPSRIQALPYHAIRWFVAFYPLCIWAFLFGFAAYTYSSETKKVTNVEERSNPSFQRTCLRQAAEVKR